MKIEIQNLCKTIKKVPILQDITVTFESGKIYGLKGKNGSGKTMLMRAISGLIIPNSGTINIDGEILGKDISFPRSIGILIENPSFLGNYTGYKNLEMLASIQNRIGEDEIRETLAEVGLDPDDKRTYRKYSLGMKQRLAIALAVMHNPELLILDEPINGLDPIGIAEVRDFIRELCDATGKTILISSHILSEISLLADDVGIIDHGNLLEEKSLKALEGKNAKYIHFCVSDAQKAAQIIAATFQSKNIQLMDDNNWYLYDTALPVARINRTFIEAGIDVWEAHLCEDTLEDYFKRITGGEGIA